MTGSKGGGFPNLKKESLRITQTAPGYFPGRRYPEKWISFYGDFLPPYKKIPVNQ